MDEKRREEKATKKKSEKQDHGRNKKVGRKRRKFYMSDSDCETSDDDPSFKLTARLKRELEKIREPLKTSTIAEKLDTPLSSDAPHGA